MHTRPEVIEKTSIVAYGVLQELHAALVDPDAPDEITLGFIMALAMYLDEHVGPMRGQRLMQEAPRIVLKTDAHVTAEVLARMAPVVRAFGGRLKTYKGGKWPA